VRLQVKGKNVEVSDSLRTYAQEKLGRLDKHLNDAARLEVELAVEKNPSIAESQIAEGTIWTKGPVLRARESAPDMYQAIDGAAHKLERQIGRYRQRRRRNRVRHDALFAPEELPVQRVDALAPAALDVDEARELELAEMAGRGRPAAIEARRDLARRHAAAAEVEHEQDLAPRGVREAREDRVDLLELALRVATARGSGSAGRGETPCWGGHREPRSDDPSAPRSP